MVLTHNEAIELEEAVERAESVDTDRPMALWPVDLAAAGNSSSLRMRLCLSVVVRTFDSKLNHTSKIALLAAKIQHEVHLQHSI